MISRITAVTSKFTPLGTTGVVVGGCVLLSAISVYNLNKPTNISDNKRNAENRNKLRVRLINHKATRKESRY